MPDVGAQQRVGVHDGAPQQSKPNIVEGGHAEFRSQRTLVPQQRRRPRHVGAHGDRPETELIIRQQVAGKGKQHGEQHQNHAHHPVELPRLLVGARQKDSEHMQPDRDNHQMGGPAVHVSQQLPKGHVVFQVENVPEGLYLGGVVVEHQQDAGKGQHDEQIEGDPSHAPGVVVGDRVAIDLGRVQMQEDVGQDPQRAVARLLVVGHPKDRLEELGLLGLLERLNIVEGLLLEVLDFLQDAVDQGRPLARRFLLFQIVCHGSTPRMDTCNPGYAESPTGYNCRNAPGSRNSDRIPLGHS